MKLTVDLANSQNKNGSRYHNTTFPSHLIQSLKQTLTQASEFLGIHTTICVHLSKSWSCTIKTSKCYKSEFEYANTKVILRFRYPSRKIHTSTDSCFRQLLYWVSASCQEHDRYTRNLRTKKININIQWFQPCKNKALTYYTIFTLRILRFKSLSQVATM